MKVFGAIDDIQPHKHFVTIWMIANEYGGMLTIMDPNKQDDWQWFDIYHLPDNIYLPSKKFIDAY